MELRDILICLLLSCVKGQDLLSIQPEVFIEGEPGNVTCTYNNKETTFFIYNNISGQQSITACYLQSPLPCVVNPTLTGYRQHYSVSNTSNSVTIHINAVNRSRDSGEWRCSAIVTTLIQDSITIDVKVPVSSVDITNKNVYLIKDRTVNLECKTTGGYPLPNITWSLVSRILMTSVSTTTSRLPYKPVVSDQGKRLQCSATNGYGQSQTDSFQLTIKYKPIINIKPSITPYKLIQNQTVQLECQVNQSNPVVTSYKWYRDGNMIAASSLYYTVSNDGSYSCSATNSVGESERSRVISVEVLYPPTVSTSQSPYSIIESTTLTIPCIATSNPVPNNYTWSGPNNLLQSQQNLTISSINRDQAGQYTCTVSNIMVPTTGGEQTGIGFSSTTVNVLSSPNSPQSVRLRNKTYVICIEWTSGFNGGASQSFIVQHSTDDKTWVNSSTIPDSTNNGRVDYCIEGLKPDSSYNIRVIASNKYGESKFGIYTDKQETQTTQSSTRAATDSYSGVNDGNGCDDRFGAGIGTGLGISLAIHAVIILGIFLYRYQQGKRKKSEQTYDTVAARTPADGQTYQELNIVRPVETPQKVSDAAHYYNLGADQTTT